VQGAYPGNWKALTPICAYEIMSDEKVQLDLRDARDGVPSTHNASNKNRHSYLAARPARSVAADECPRDC